MEYLIAILLGTIGSFIAAEIYVTAPKLALRLIDKAVLRLPEHERDRYREEWCAHLNDCPGSLGKLRHAPACYLVAASGVTRALAIPSRKQIDGTDSAASKEDSNNNFRRHIIIATTLGIFLGVSFWTTHTFFDRHMQADAMANIILRQEETHATDMARLRCAQM